MRRTDSLTLAIGKDSPNITAPTTVFQEFEVEEALLTLNIRTNYKLHQGKSWKGKVLLAFSHKLVS